MQVGTATDWTVDSRRRLPHLRDPHRRHPVVLGRQRNYGQLGDGTTTDRNSPVQVGTATDWTAVAAGESTTPAASAAPGPSGAGATTSTGSSATAPPPNGTPPSRSAPPPTGPPSPPAAHTCGTAHPGTLWCWGYNGYGQLGDGTTTERRTPAQVGAATDWTAVTAGDSHTCGTRNRRHPLVLGHNLDGQLGDGTTTDRTTPAQVGTATDWTAVTAGCPTRARSTPEPRRWGANWTGSSATARGALRSRLRNPVYALRTGCLSLFLEA